MRKNLPVRPNLEHLKSQAKDLLEAYRRGEREAFERFRDALPAAGGAGDSQLAAMALALHDAQSVIAREYGFASWAELRAHVEAAFPTPEVLRALMQPHLSSPLPAEVERALIESASNGQVKDVPVLSPLPLLPVRNAVLAVGATVPLNIGRPASLAAVEAARDGGKMLAVFAQKDETKEAPAEADLHLVGCAARLMAVIPTQSGAVWIVVRATQWIRLDAIDRREPYLLARIEPFAVQQENTTEVTRLEQALRERVSALAADLPGGAQLLRMTERMSALELADATMANLSCSVEDKARYANEPSLTERLKHVLALCDRAA